MTSQYSPWPESGATQGTASTTSSTASTSSSSEMTPVQAAIEASSWTREDIELLLNAIMVLVLLANLYAEVTN